MASAPVVSSPSDYSTQTFPFDISGTSDGQLVEVRGENGLLLPANVNPVPVAGGNFTIQGISSLVGTRGALYTSTSGIAQAAVIASAGAGGSTRAAVSASGSAGGVALAAITQSAASGGVAKASVAVSATAGGQADTGAGAAASMVPNPGFESAITATSETSAAWWKELGSGTFADRYASVTMTGSYVGRIAAAGSGGGDPEYDPAVPGEGYLGVKLLPTPSGKLSVDGSDTPAAGTAGTVLTFDLRPVALSGTAQARLDVYAYDSGGTLIVGSTTVTNAAQSILFGSVISAMSTAIRVASPAMNTTYSGKTLDVKSIVTANLSSGKTWANVAKVVVRFVGYAQAAGDAVEFYFDNFR